MTLFDLNDSNPEPPQSSDPLRITVSEVQSVPDFNEIPPGDPFTYGAHHPQPYYFAPPAPSDLDVPWSWGHLLLFVLYAVVSFVMVQTGLLTYYVLTKRISSHPTQKEFQQFAYSTPVFSIGILVLWYAALFLFFYYTLTVYYRAPFWQSLGWRKLNPENHRAPAKRWVYFLLGCGMSLVVAVLTVAVKAPENAPIQDMLKNRTMAFAFMGMAVLIAPFAEETLFRGYLYPVLARIISAILRYFGMAASEAASASVYSSIVLTGVCFGLMHGYQLGWSKAIVAALIGVGIVLAVVRSRAQSTLASFLTHLGYNSLIAFFGVIGLIHEIYSKVPPSHR